MYVLAGAYHKLAVSSVDPKYFASLTEAYEALDEHMAACKYVYEFGNREMNLLRYGT